MRSALTVACFAAPLLAACAAGSPAQKALMPAAFAAHQADVDARLARDVDCSRVNNERPEDGPAVAERKASCNRALAEREAEEKRLIAEEARRAELAEARAKQEREVQWNAREAARRAALPPADREAEDRWLSDRVEAARRRRESFNTWHWVASRRECVPIADIWPGAQSPEDVVRKLRNNDASAHQTSVRLAPDQPWEVRVLRTQDGELTLTRTREGCAPAQNVIVRRW